MKKNLLELLIMILVVAKLWFHTRKCPHILFAVNVSSGCYFSSSDEALTEGRRMAVAEGIFKIGIGVIVSCWSH